MLRVHRGRALVHKRPQTSSVPPWYLISLPNIASLSQSPDPRSRSINPRRARSLMRCCELVVELAIDLHHHSPSSLSLFNSTHRDRSNAPGLVFQESMPASPSSHLCRGRRRRARACCRMGALFRSLRARMSISKPPHPPRPLSIVLGCPEVSPWSTSVLARVSSSLQLVAWR
jgi:hypothetical protein